MRFSKILVPVAGIPADEAAIHLAGHVAKRDRAKVLLIAVVEVQRTLPLDAENLPQAQRAEQSLEHAEQAAKAVWGQVESEMLQARAAGPALVDEALERGVDLIVMGIPYRKPLDDFVMGTTTTYVLKNALCPVWLCREAVSAGAKGRKGG